MGNVADCSITSHAPLRETVEAIVHLEAERSIGQCFLSTELLPELCPPDMLADVHSVYSRCGLKMESLFNATDN